MEKRKLGRNGPAVSAIGLGCMAFSGTYGPTTEQESIATIRAALEAGVTLLDTGDFYGMGHNEMLLQKALAGRPRDSYFLSVKFGGMRAPNGAFIGFDARPAAVKNSLSYTLRRLGTDYVDLYFPSRVDPHVPIEDTVGAISEMVKAGYVRHVGLSEASSETIRRAHATHPLAALQIEYSLATRGIEAEILPAARQHGISVVAYGIFSRGLLTGSAPSRESAAHGDIRGHFPRFHQQNLDKNTRVISRLREIAAKQGVSVAQLATAWALGRGEDVVPLAGVRNREQLTEALEGLKVALSAEAQAALEREIPAGALAGERYAPEQMAVLDSERATAGAGQKHSRGISGRSKIAGS
jgi:aryl-alcohol dehydrogenase-like predicted oxidoreductase